VDAWVDFMGGRESLYLRTSSAIGTRFPFMII
jgi:hypothetical protein